MIIDNIENISKYSAVIPANVIKFLKNISPEVGHYDIDEKSYANVDMYIPKPYDNCQFEAHKKYIDIQMVLFGEENLEYTIAEGLEISENYNDNKDIMFFDNPDYIVDSVHLTPNKFVLISSLSSYLSTLLIFKIASVL